MIYRPKTGAMWDPSVLWYDGMFHAIVMYNVDGDNGLEAGHGLILVSEDGVHWRDGWIATAERERERGCRFFKAFMGRVGDRFIMDHGVQRPEGQDTLRFYESQDLKTWTYLLSNHPAPQWYVTSGRWDHMYILPKEEGNPAAGYWGYVVATPKEGLPRGLGMMETTDGREWTILPPPEMDWGDVPPKDLEIGGCERIGDRYVMIGGAFGHVSKGYSMYVLIADDPRGPFRPDAEAYRLCGATSRHVSWLAAWSRGKDELLISNYMSMADKDWAPWMLPLRKPVFDDGHLRLGWWPGNEALKGSEVPWDPVLELSQAGPGAAMVEHRFDLGKGAVLEGTIRAKATGAGAAAGFLFAQRNEQPMALLLGIGAAGDRETHIGTVTMGANGLEQLDSEDVTGAGCATVTGIEDGREHSFRVLFRHKAFEVYVDDLLVQTYFYRPGDGRIGFAARNTEASFTDMRAWEMSL